MNILGYTPDRLIDFVEQGLKILKSKCGVDKDCGYFSILSANTGDGILLISKIGICPPEKVERYLNFSQEKAKRLFADTASSSSFQSRDPDNDKYAGAIRVRSVILSFSGLPELADEALMVFVALSAGWISEVEALRFSTISDNDYIKAIVIFMRLAMVY